MGDLEEVLSKRKSIRRFTATLLDIAEVLKLCWASQMIPSAGALYPLRLYYLNNQSVYKYSFKKRRLRLVIEGDIRKDLAIQQSFVSKAPAVFVITAIYKKTTAKYGQRGVRYVHMEAGHAAQNIYLQTTNLGLGTVAIGAFNDRVVKKVLRLSDDEEPLYIMPVGKPCQPI